MTTRDFHNNFLLKRAISPSNTTDNTALVSQIIDTLNYSGLEFIILTGSLADADATFTVLVEEGDNSALSDAAAVADENLLGTEAGASFTFASDDQVRKIGYIGKKRYVRLTITPANNTGNSYIAAAALLTQPGFAPVTQSTS